MTMMISVIMPAYQEAPNLEQLLPKLKHVLQTICSEWEILVIDTMKPMDDTKKVCETHGAICINRLGGNLYGDAIRTGINLARGKYIVIMDADGSHNPSDITRFYMEMQTGKYDVVIGSRYCKGGSTENSVVLQMMSFALNITYRILFHLKIRDVSDSFRLYSSEKIKTLHLECDNFDIVEEIIIKLGVKYDSLKIKEIPISFNKRALGKSKRDLAKFIQSYLKTIAFLMKIKRQAMREKRARG